MEFLVAVYSVKDATEAESMKKARTLRLELPFPNVSSSLYTERKISRNSTT